jgi:hypothetical protein
MTTPTPLTRLPLLRRLFVGDRALVALVLVIGFFTVPRLLSLLMTTHFEAQDSAILYVAVQDAGNGFDLTALRTPVLLQTPAFVTDGDKPSAPGSTEAADPVRVLARDGAGPLMETVWSNDDYVVTSRYRVTGQRLHPVSRQTFGDPHATLGALISVVISTALASVLARRRRHRELERA